MPPKQKMIILARLLHIVSAVYNLAFVYTPLHAWVHGFAVVQYVSMPLLLVSGAALVKLRKKAA